MKMSLKRLESRLANVNDIVDINNAVVNAHPSLIEKLEYFNGIRDRIGNCYQDSKNNRRVIRAMEKKYKAALKSGTYSKQHVAELRKSIERIKALVGKNDNTLNNTLKLVDGALDEYEDELKSVISPEGD